MTRMQHGLLGFWPAALVLAFVLCPDAWGQLALSPTMIEDRAYPGGLRTFMLSISNAGADALNCSVEVSALEVLAGGLPVEVKDAPRSCRDWITVETPRFRLAPKEGKVLVCRVQPAKNTSGGYYAILACQGNPDRGPDERADAGVSAGIRFSYRNLVPVLLTVPVGELRPVLDVGNPLLAPARDGAGYALNIPVRNRGNIHTRMGGSVEVRSEAGQLVDRFDLEAGRGFILPEHERMFTAQVRVNLPDGVFTAAVRLEAEGTSQAMRNAFSFSVLNGQPSLAAVTDAMRAQLKTQAAGFTVNPAQMQFPLRPGARRAQAVEVVNLTRETLSLRARTTEWLRTPEGQDLVSDQSPPHGRSGRAIIELTQPEIELAPMGRRRVPLAIALPAGATGERYAAVTFDRPDLALDASPKSLARRSVVLQVYAEGTGDPKAEIAALEARRAASGAVDLVARIRNTGDVGLEPEASFTVYDSRSRAVGKVAPASKPAFVQAGGESVIAAQWTQVLEGGTYTAELALAFVRTKPPVSKRVEFVVPAAGPDAAPAPASPKAAAPDKPPETKP